MYKKTHRNSQRRADALTPNNLAHGDLLLTPEQHRDSLVSAWKGLGDRLKTEKRPSVRASLGSQMQELQNQIRAIRPKKKAPGVNQYFIDAAREFLPKPQFNLIMDRAVEMLKQSEGEK